MQQLKVIVYTKTEKNLKIITLNERSQIQMSWHGMILFTWNFRALIYSDGSQITDPLGCGWGSRTAARHKRSLEVTKVFQCSIVGMLQSASVSQNVLKHRNKLVLFIRYVISQYLFKVYTTTKNRNSILHNSKSLSWLEQLKKISE